jgi:RNA polymerase sigma factor (sigma-70 family)
VTEAANGGSSRATRPILQKRLKQDSLREGTQITVSGWHARDQGLKIFCGSEVTFEDGSKRQFGTAHAFYQRYKDKVYSISLYFFHGDDAAASDATQQVFLKLMTGIGQFKDDCEFSTGLYRMVVNTCLDGTKAAKRREPLADAAKLARIAAPQSAEEDRARAEVAGKVQIALSSLPPKLRLPVLLRYL